MRSLNGTISLNVQARLRRGVCFAPKPENADVILTQDLRIDTPWMYISHSPSTVAEWIYISDSASELAEWAYIADSPKDADIIIYAESPNMRGPRVIACVLEYLKRKRKQADE